MTLTIEDFVHQLENVSGATTIDPDTPLSQVSDVDSMDLMEWLYDFQTKHPGSPIDATVFENEDGSATCRIFYSRLVALVA